MRRPEPRDDESRPAAAVYKRTASGSACCCSWSPCPRLPAGSPPVARSTAAHGRRLPASRPRRTGLRRAAVPSDDWTYRPTVVVRRGTSQGSGTIIASVDGETLVLTAAHVVKDEGPVWVELHRYNLGLERTAAAPGAWPRVIQAAPAARDLAADVAIVRLEKMTALPYVARLAPSAEKPQPSSVVSSLGIDLGRKLSMWSTRLVETISLELNDSGETRPFLITEKIPEHGRSGGGLFLASGELVGVCVGHAALDKGRRRGVFAAGASIQLLLEDHALNVAVHRSEERMARMRRDRSAATCAAKREQPGSIVTTSRSQSEDTPGPNHP